MAVSVKTKEHIRRRLALALPKWGALLGGAAALALSILFTSQALHYVIVSDTELCREYSDGFIHHRRCLVHRFLRCILSE